MFQSKKEQRIYENYKFTCLQSIVKYIVAFLNQWLLGGDGCCCFYCYLCVLLRNQTHNVQMDNIAPGGAVQCSVLPFYGNPTEANIFAYICSKRKTYTSLMIYKYVSFFLKSTKFEGNPFFNNRIATGY